MKLAGPAAPRKIFLSHSHRDRRFVRRLTGFLRAQNLGVWYSTHHIRGGKKWIDEIDWFLVVLSPSSVKSMWVQREVAYALTQRRYQERIIPVLLRDCNEAGLGWPLEQYQQVDFRGSFPKGCTALLRIWKSESRQDI